MIDLDAIKAIPDEKPRKGPARMSKSEKDVEARRRYKRKTSLDRILLRSLWRLRNLDQPMSYELWTKP